MKSVGDSHRIIAQVEDMSKERAIKALNLPERLWTIRFYLMDKMELKDSATHSYKGSHEAKKVWQVDFNTLMQDLPAIFSAPVITRHDILEIYGRMNGMMNSHHVWSWEYDELNHLMPWPTMNYLMRGWMKVEEKLEKL